ncbi:AfsA-related hotdog domain-containing protein [Paraburkholderia sp.]|uniref:AfsA-related hotdog domain-containing protein n=1 Tax=Paraburkholderia sp. TaxID=1926495 RepID=UPI00286EFA7C|nr:AfsA-related hotdog domain-containing protein [Paraburkholderia sp.]
MLLADLEIHQDLNLDAEQTVPRKMVHRAALSEIFLTRGAKINESRFQCLAQLPQTNKYFNDISSKIIGYDLILLIEVFRQASIYVSHAFIGVPIESKFLYIDSETSVVAQNGLELGNTPVAAIVDVRIVDEYRRRGVLQGVTLDMLLLIDGIVVARHDRMRIQWMDDGTWKRVREKGLSRFPDGVNARCPATTPIQPDIVGRKWLDNVVIGDVVLEKDGELRTGLLIPFQNKAIFDHPLDHIPGMLMLEAFRQTAFVAISRANGLPSDHLALWRCKVEFAKFGEFGFQTECSIRDEKIIQKDSGNLIICNEIILKQDEVVIATADLSFKVS